MNVMTFIINYKTTPKVRKAMTQAPKQQKTYLKYDRRLRLELIRLVDEENLSTTSAAKRLGIKQTSACKIMRTFHHEHRIFQSKADRTRRLERGESAPKPRIIRRRKRVSQPEEVYDSSSQNQAAIVPPAEEAPHASMVNSSNRRAQQAQEAPQAAIQQVGPQLEPWSSYPVQMCYFLPFQNGFPWPGS